MPTFGQNILKSHALQNLVSISFKKWCTLIVGRCCKSKWIRYCYCWDCHLIRGGFIHKQSSLFPYVFLVFVRVPGLPHSLSSIHFILHPGFSFQNRLTLCDSNTLDNFKDSREQQPYPEIRPPKTKPQNASINGGKWEESRSFGKWQKPWSVERDFFWGLYLSYISGRYVALTWFKKKSLKVTLISS